MNGRELFEALCQQAASANSKTYEEVVADLEAAQAARDAEIRAAARSKLVMGMKRR